MEIRNTYGHYNVLDADGGVIAGFTTLEAAAIVMRFLMGVPQDADERGKALAFIEAHDEEERRKEAERAARKQAEREKAAARKAMKQADAAKQEEGAAE